MLWMEKQEAKRYHYAFMGDYMAIQTQACCPHSLGYLRKVILFSKTTVTYYLYLIAKCFLIIKQWLLYFMLLG